jgi:hypothetical protein
MFDTDVQTFCNWLSNTPVSVWIQTTNWIIPWSQSVHIIAISLLAGVMLRMDARLLGVFGRNQTVAEMADRYMPWLWRLLVVALCTGIIQTVAEPTRQLMNPSFRWKMFLLALVLTLTILFVRQVRKNVDGWDRLPTSYGAKLVATVSICCWISIILLGRWIAYTQ